MSGNSNLKISIVLALHKPNLNFLEQQLRSILAQDYWDFSLVLSQDVVSDEALSVITRIADQRVTVVKNQTTPGVIENFENAIRHAPLDTNIYLFSDQDDLWKPNKLETIVNYFRNHPEVALYHHDLSLIDENGDQLASSCWTEECRNVTDYSLKQIILSNVVTGCSMAVRADLLRASLPFPKQRDIDGLPLVFHDHWITLICCSRGDKIYSDSVVLVDYRQHSRNLVGSPRPLQFSIKKLKKMSFRKLLECSRRALWRRQYIEFELQRKFPSQKNVNDSFVYTRFKVKSVAKFVPLALSNLKEWRILLQLAVGIVFQRDK